MLKKMARTKAFTLSLFLNLLLVLYFLYNDQISTNITIQSQSANRLDLGQINGDFNHLNIQVGKKLNIWNSGTTTFSETNVQPEIKSGRKYHTSKGNSTKIYSNLLPCSVINHFYFLKIFKAGSTTLQNIFLRYSMRNNLNVMTIFHKEKFTSKDDRRFDHLLPPPPKSLDNGKYDVYCEHSIYDEKYLLSKLHSDTVNIAIIREPYSRAQSAFKFYNMTEKLGITNDDPFATLLDNIQTYGKNRKCNLIRDQMIQQFGCGIESDRIQKCLSYIESKFLVLIMENMSESLVLMKRKLCWKFKDILCAHTRQNNYTRVEDRKQILKYKRFSPLDFKLYNHFSKVFAQQISMEKNGFKDEVAFLDNSLYNTKQFCDTICHKMGNVMRKKNLSVSYDDARAVLDEEFWFEKSPWEDKFRISGLDCLMMRFDPQVYRNAQKVKLFPEFCTDSAPKHIKSLNIDGQFCEQHFNYTFPWSLFKNPRFVAPCY